jgi:hypothetical protein
LSRLNAYILPYARKYIKADTDIRFLETLFAKKYGKILANLRVFGLERCKLRESTLKSNGTGPKSVDDELADHLKFAEEHLISAIHLFLRENKPIRDGNYLKRLYGAQETVTSLYRGELIRIRGVLKPPKIGRK